MIEAFRYFIETYQVFISGEQKWWALVMALLFIIYGRWCNRSWAMCLIAGFAIYCAALAYAINDNNLQVIKSEIRAKHL